jgi:hypothetical protein
MTRIALPQVVERLQTYFGKQKPLKLDGPWEMILWENVSPALSSRPLRKSLARIVRG